MSEQLRTFADLYTEVYRRMRVSGTGTGEEATAKRFINQANYDLYIGNGEKFSWAERQGEIRTRAPITYTDLMFFTRRVILSTSATFQDDDEFGVAQVRAGGFLLLEGEPYEVEEVTGPGGLTLRTQYTGDTTGQKTGVYYEPSYALPIDFLRPQDEQIFSASRRIEVRNLDRRRFRQRWSYTLGEPRFATYYRADDYLDSGAAGEDDPQRVEFWPIPDAVYRLPFSYVTGHIAIVSGGNRAANMDQDNDRPILPLRYRHILVEYAAWLWYRDRKDDVRANAAFASYRDMLDRMTADTEIGRPRPRMRTTMAERRLRNRRPYTRRGTRRFDVGGRFDRLEDL